MGFVSVFEILEKENNDLDSLLYIYFDLSKWVIMGYLLGGVVMIKVVVYMDLSVVVVFVLVINFVSFGSNVILSDFLIFGEIVVKILL